MVVDYDRIEPWRLSVMVALALARADAPALLGEMWGSKQTKSENVAPGRGVFTALSHHCPSTPEFNYCSNCSSEAQQTIQNQHAYHPS